MAISILLEYLDFEPLQFGGQGDALQAERESEDSPLQKGEKASGASGYYYDDDDGGDDDDDGDDDRIRPAPKREKLESWEQR